ncbi:uncharacterized protein METZ01_LOCUS96252 [marine metagenome]|uniref:Uncharacterized protein n=1 Tax=marine metagenome TaxID=408172 RepID=A0A381VUF8_9ZZZZ
MARQRILLVNGSFPGSVRKQSIRPEVDGFIIAM